MATNFHYVLLDAAEPDGYRHHISPNGEFDNGREWILLGEIELPDPDPRVIAQRGGNFCDEAEAKCQAEAEVTLGRIKDARAKYLSLEPPQ